MIDLLPQLIVLALGGSIAPALLLLTILFLGSQRPLPNATALVLGYFAVCAAVGVAGLILFSGTAGAAGSTASTIGRVIQRDARRTAHCLRPQETFHYTGSRRVSAQVDGSGELHNAG